MSSQHIVLATNSPLHHNLLVHSRQSPYRTYVSGLQLSEVCHISVAALLAVHDTG